MAIVLGAVDDNFNIIPPQGGFGGIDGCRIANYTGDALIITNIDTERPGQQYLMPFQQMVYRIENLRQPPSIDALILGRDFSTSQVLVEWSTEALNDFAGVYPVDLTQAALTAGLAAPQWGTHTLTVADDGATHTIPADTKRVSLTLINRGTKNVQLSAWDSGWPHPNRFIAPGEGRAIPTLAAVYTRVAAGDGDQIVEWFETRYTPSDPT